MRHQHQYTSPRHPPVQRFAPDYLVRLRGAGGGPGPPPDQLAGPWKRSPFRQPGRSPCSAWRIRRRRPARSPCGGRETARLWTLLLPALDRETALPPGERETADGYPVLACTGAGVPRSPAGSTGTIPRWARVFTSWRRSSARLLPWHPARGRRPGSREQVAGIRARQQQPVRKKDGGKGRRWRRPPCTAVRSPTSNRTPCDKVSGCSCLTGSDGSRQAP